MGAYIIAELGINHNGDVEICKQMINEAKAAGVDAVKLQIVNPKLISSVPWLIEAQGRAYLNLDEYKEIVAHARNLDIEIFSSFGDIKSIEMFDALGLGKIKVSSSNLKNWPLHDRVASHKVPVILSTGDAYLSELLKVVEFYKKSQIDLSLTYCVSKYPAEPSDVILKTIPYFRNMFGIPIGFSDHTPGILTSVLAVAMGAEMIEKHITLDKTMEGPDHHFSLDPEELSELASTIRTTEKMLGNPEDYFFRTMNLDESIIRRSILFTEDKPAGYVIKENDIIVGRPSYHSGHEIDPADYRSVVGCCLNKPIGAFEPLEYGHFS